MKRKDLALLTLLLTQTAPVLAMWTAEDEKAMTEAGKGQPRISVQHKKLEPFIPPSLNTLDPSDPLPKDLGKAKQIVSCIFGKNPPIEITLPTEYPLHGQWCFQEDRDNTQNLATLKLSALLNKEEWKVAFKREVAIQHQLVKSEKEVPGDNYFDGDRVYKARTKLQRWKNPKTGKEYDRTLATLDCKVHHHKEYDVIYVEPFAFGGNPSKPKDEYRGEYKFIRDLGEKGGLPGKKLENLLYSDGKDVYLPHISQELWNKNGSQAGFFIASYRSEQRLNFIPGAKIQGGKLPEGLYQLLSVQDDLKQNKRTEKWQKLGNDPKVIEVTASVGVSSIAGMGGYAPHVVSNDEFLLKTLNLQNRIQDIIKKTEEAKSLYPHVKGSVIVLGKTGSGKTTLIHGLAGGLHAKEDHHGMLHLYANDPLPGFHIGHDLGVGTKVPSVWHDPENDILYWDCPGFEDVRGEEEDILNAFAIKRLFNTNVKVVLVADDTDLNTGSTKGQRFLKLLDKMTNLFTNEQQLKDNLSLVVTKGTNITPHTRISILQENVLSKGKEIQLTEKSKNILNFLHENKSRVNSLSQPTEIGSYTVSDKITTSIHKAKFVPNLQVNFKAGISAEAKLLAGKYGKGLDDYLTNYMKTEGAQRVINFCSQRIDQYTGPVDNLRTEFKNLLNTLEKLPTDSRTNFINKLKFIDVDEITKIIETINFLKTINDTVTWNIGNWKSALLDNIRTKIKTLTDEPIVEFTSNTLHLKGVFIGTSDVQNALKQHSTAQNLNVFALNSLFLEDSFTKPGLSYSCLAPQWKVLKPLTINLSGSHGKAGANANTAGGDGAPGGVGGNGGPFFGLVDVIDFPDKLTINTSGGNGGIGGNGAKGADGASGAKGAGGSQGAKGADGENGKPGVKGGTAESGTDGTAGQSGQPGNAGGTGQPGKPGERGRDGGKAGQGGLAGQAGTLEIKASLPEKNKVSQKGSEGANGTPGQGGTGGQGGPGGNGGQGGPGGNGGQGGLGGQAGIGAVKIQNKYFKDQNMPSSLDAGCNEQVYISNENSDNTYWYVVPAHGGGEGYFQIVSKWHYDRKQPHFLDLCSPTYRSTGAWTVWRLTPGLNGSFKINGKYFIDQGTPSSLRIEGRTVHRGMDHDNDKAYWHLTPGAYNVQAGANGANGQPGAKGPDGQPGAKGPDGPNGNLGQGLNSAGLQKPAPQVPLNSGAITQSYNLYYQQQALNPNVAPFIKVFPGLK